MPNICFSLRPVGGAGADTETERGVSAGGCCSPRSDDGCDGDDVAGVEPAGARCSCGRVLASALVTLRTIFVAAALFVLVCEA